MISWQDTCSAIQNLDLVISSCTSIAHLASAMGKPTWVIVPVLPYHIWAYGDEHSPWYQKSTKVFRQEKFGEWNKTFIKLESELVTKFGLQTKSKKIKKILEKSS
jgi:ADP-heptose:LPS heptosyltransferase